MIAVTIESGKTRTDGTPGRSTMEPFTSGSFQRFAMVGVCNSDEFAGTLTQIFAIEVSDPLLGDDVMYVGTGCYNARTLFEKGHDLAFAFGRG